MKKEDLILGRLRQEGHRITTLRKSIIHALLREKAPVSTLELHERLTKADLPMNKTTMYRELDFLKKTGVVRELQLGDRSRRYEILPDDHRHHLICRTCNGVEDVALEHDLDDVEKRVRKQTNFKVEDHALAFYGTCAKCQ